MTPLVLQRLYANKSAHPPPPAAAEEPGGSYDHRREAFASVGDDVIWLHMECAQVSRAPA